MTHASVALSPRQPLGLGIRAMAAAAVLLAVVAAPALAQSPSAEPHPDAQGQALGDRFLTILSLPDAEKREGLEGFLAPEFQLIRADATRLDRDGYIADPASVEEYAVEDLVVTGSDGVIVATYLLSATVTIDEVTRTTTAPRLSAFARHGDEWLMSAHANFSPLAEDTSASPAP
jgi:hypothetical protein